MSELRQPYIAYLLRLWQVRDGGQVGWRASLENAHTGRRQAFASLDELFNFLGSEVCQVGQVQTTLTTGGKGVDIDK
jgi:hypothetical protein